MYDPPFDEAILTESRDVSKFPRAIPTARSRYAGSDRAPEALTDPFLPYTTACKPMISAMSRLPLLHHLRGCFPCSPIMDVGEYVAGPGLVRGAGCSLAAVSSFCLSVPTTRQGLNAGSAATGYRSAAIPWFVAALSASTYVRYGASPVFAWRCRRPQFGHVASQRMSVSC